MPKRDDIVTVRGEQVRVLSVDANPDCQIWGVALADCDRSVWFLASEIA